jgi:type VI secretion system protein ImpL
MKYIMNTLTLRDSLQKQIIPLGIVAICMLLVWHWGPLISIGSHVPLHHREKRIYATLAIFFCWLLKLIFWETPPPRNAKIKPIKQPPISLLPVLKTVLQKAQSLLPLLLIPLLQLRTAGKKLQQSAFNMNSSISKPHILEGRFQGASQFLQKTFIQKEGRDVSLSNLPLYLVIGATGSGKTTLLANANINLVLAKQVAPENMQSISTSESCDWWVTRDQALIDVPGNYINSHEKESLWDNLLTLISKHQTSQTLNGVVIALPVADLLGPNQQQREQHINNLHQRINELRKEFGDDLPFYLAITKCDLLPGFLEFFSDCGSDELTQAWGITLPSSKDRNSEPLVNAFITRFNALIKRLNKQLLWRLHQERDPFVRPQIKDFPLQVERLKETIIEVLKTFSTAKSTLALQGVYLTSAIQHPAEESGTTVASASTGQQALQIMQTPPLSIRSYFVRQFILSGLSATYTPPVQTAPPLKKPRFMPVVAIPLGVILVAAAIIGTDYRHAVQQSMMVKNTVKKYQGQVQQIREPHLVNALPIVDSLEQASNNSAHTWIIHSNKAQKAADTVYHEALETLVVPGIKNDLEKYLLEGANKTPESLYAALKSYLMLGYPEQFKAEYLVTTLKEIEPNVTKGLNLKQVTGYFQNAFNNSHKPLALNADLISRVRRQLINLPPTVLRLAAAESLQGNWVLGNIATASAIRRDSHTGVISRAPYLG